MNSSWISTGLRNITLRLVFDKGQDTLWPIFVPTTDLDEIYIKKRLEFGDPYTQFF